MPSVSLDKMETGTLAAWLIKKFPEQLKLPEGSLEGGLVHRLDNETSGLIVVARTLSAYKNLRTQFESGKIRKEYIALVVGGAPSRGVIDTWIAHHPNKKKKMIVCEDRDHKAREAKTIFETKKRYENYTLLSVQIKTGVRHQIRVHLASIGCPLAGDKLYQSSNTSKIDTLKLDRHFLHASFLSFKDPVNGKKVQFSSPLPKDLKSALLTL